MLNDVNYSNFLIATKRGVELVVMRWNPLILYQQLKILLIVNFVDPWTAREILIRNLKLYSAADIFGQISELNNGSKILKDLVGKWDFFLRLWYRVIFYYHIFRSFRAVIAEKTREMDKWTNQPTRCLHFSTQSNLLIVQMFKV